MDFIIKFCAQYLPYLVVLIVAAAWFRQSTKERRSLILRGITAAMLCAGFAYIAGEIYHDTRPFVRLHRPPLIPHVPDNGFPSDYTLFAAACAFVLMPYARPLAYISLVIAVIVAWARVASLLHTPVDVIASFFLAAAAAAMARVIVRRRQKSLPPPSSEAGTNVSANAA